MKHNTQYTIHNTILLVSVLVLSITLIGCDAFVRKFTRKSKKENLPQEEMVLSPEEYKGFGMTKEELYRQYFLFWKSWHDELISALSQNSSHKKQIDCIQEAIKNLISLRGLLTEDKQKKLDIYIAQLKNLKALIDEDLYGTNNTGNLWSAEHLKRQISQGFSYNKIKDYLR